MFLPEDIAPIEDFTPVESMPVDDVSGSVEVAGSTETEPQQLGSAGTAETAAPVAASRGLIPSTPIALALVLLALLGSALVAYGLRRYEAATFAVGGTTTCPLETS